MMNVKAIKSIDTIFRNKDKEYCRSKLDKIFKIEC